MGVKNFRHCKTVNKSGGGKSLVCQMLHVQWNVKFSDGLPKLVGWFLGSPCSLNPAHCRRQRTWDPSQIQPPEWIDYCNPAVKINLRICSLEKGHFKDIKRSLLNQTQDMSDFTWPSRCLGWTQRQWHYPIQVHQQLATPGEQHQQAALPCFSNTPFNSFSCQIKYVNKEIDRSYTMFFFFFCLQRSSHFLAWIMKQSKTKHFCVSFEANRITMSAFVNDNPLPWTYVLQVPQEIICCFLLLDPLIVSCLSRSPGVCISLR